MLSPPDGLRDPDIEQLHALYGDRVTDRGNSMAHVALAKIKNAMNALRQLDVKDDVVADLMEEIQIVLKGAMSSRF
jgi:hypothetical protein